MTEVEAVARAICQARQPMTDPDKTAVFPRGQLGAGPHWQVFYEQAARAAIKALDERRPRGSGAAREALWVAINSALIDWQISDSSSDANLVTHLVGAVLEVLDQAEDPERDKASDPA
jgi:hypothetical protein